MALNHSLSLTCIVVLLLSVVCSADYNTNNPSPYTKPQKESLVSTTIGVQGMIYCKSGYAKPLPIQGAVVRITCLAFNKYGVQTAPFSFSSMATDENGYFFATLCPSEVPTNRKVVTECKAFLELSPDETCDVPTNINKGITGAIFSSYQLLKEKKMKLYTVGPFYYTSQPQPVSYGRGY